MNKRKIFRSVFGFFSLSGMLFVFQACYGAPQDFGQDILVKGKVISSATKQAISGIKVLVQESGQYAQSASDGSFSLYCEKMPEYNLSFSDIDGDQHGVYTVKDTLVQLPEGSETLDLVIELK